MIYRLRKSTGTKPAKSSSSKYIIFTADAMQRLAREWHRANPDFMINALKSLGRCRDKTETDLALAWHAEALDIGFWTKKDIVQYVVGCLHAKGSLITAPSFVKFLDQFTEADKDIIQKFIDTMPIKYWTLLPKEIESRKRENP